MASRKLIATLIVTFLGATSFIGIGSQLVGSENSQTAKASSSISNTAYLELSSSIWGSTSAYYTIHYWGGDTSSTWPGVAFNNNTSASGNTILTATWDTSSTHLMIVRWGDAAHTSQWNDWSYYDSNTFTPGSANYFGNDSWSNCTSYLVNENDGDIYFGKSNDWSSIYAYSYNSSHSAIMGLGAWPGTLLTDVVSDVVFDNTTLLYHLSFSKLLDDTIIFNSGSGGSQSADLSLIASTSYYKADYLTTGDTNRGAAADFVNELNNTRLAVSASGDIKEASICGISSTDATSICQNYNSFSSTIKGYINSSSIMTYTDQSSTKADVYIPVSSIMSQLSLTSGVTLTSRLTLTNHLSNNFSILLMGFICTVGVLTLGGFYLSKKKRTN